MLSSISCSRWITALLSSACLVLPAPSIIVPVSHRLCSVSLMSRPDITVIAFVSSASRSCSLRALSVANSENSASRSCSLLALSVAASVSSRLCCWSSWQSYQPAHSAIVAVRARFIAIKAKPKARVKSAPRARDFSTVINRRRTQQRYSKLPWLSCRLVASPLKHRGSRS